MTLDGLLSCCPGEHHGGAWRILGIRNGAPLPTIFSELAVSKNRFDLLSTERERKKNYRYKHVQWHPLPTSHPPPTPPPPPSVGSLLWFQCPVSPWRGKFNFFPGAELFATFPMWIAPYKGLFWRDTLKVAKNFLGLEMPLSAFWQMINFGETLSPLPLKVSHHNKPLPKCWKWHFGAKKVLGYQVAKHFLRFLWQCLAKIKPLPKCGKWHFGAKKVLGYLHTVSSK